MRKSSRTIRQEQVKQLSAIPKEMFAQRSTRNCIDLILYNGMTMRNIPDLRVKDAELWLSNDLPITEGIEQDEVLEFIRKKTARAFADQLNNLAKQFGKELSTEMLLFPDANGKQMSSSTIFRWININESTPVPSSHSVRREIATLFMLPSGSKTMQMNKYINEVHARETVVLKSVLEMIGQNQSKLNTTLRFSRRSLKFIAISWKRLPVKTKRKLRLSYST